MKSILLLLHCLLIASPLYALEPGRYLISCQEVTPNGNVPFRGYLLTVLKDADPVLEVAGSGFGLSPGSHTKSIKIIEAKDSKSILIVADFKATHPLPDGTGSAVATHSISLSFNLFGLGGGAEVAIGRTSGGGSNDAAHHHLNATIAKLPDAEQDGGGQPATRPESK
jgi:hypothetical protein